MENEPKEKTSVLEFEPQSIDFGSLGPGQGSTVTLNVHGGPGKVSVHSDQLKVSLTSFEYGDNKLEIALLGGSSGELIWDEIILHTDTSEFRVPVTARWIEHIGETPISETLEVVEGQLPAVIRISKEERTFKGKACSLCGRNFGYNIDSGLWEQCTCSWYQMVVNMSSRIIKELRYGSKDIPSYLEELWRVLLGKEKW